MERQQNKYDNNLPAGTYIVVGKYLIMKTSKKGSDFASVLYEVIEGVAKGAQFWAPLFLENDGERKNRLQWHCEACGTQQRFDPFNAGQLAEAILCKPLKVGLSRDFYRSKPQNKIKRFFTDQNGDVKNREHKVIDKWLYQNKNFKPRYKDQRNNYQNSNRSSYDRRYDDYDRTY